MKNITLPDLDNGVDVEIERENLHAAQVIYYAYQLEQMRVFQVVERIVEMFQQALLALGRGAPAESALQRFLRPGERLTERERAAVYARVLGAPGSSGESGAPNQDFLSLWLRFLLSVSAYARAHGASGVVWPLTTNNASVHHAARSLAANLSSHAGGAINAAAQRLAAETAQLLEILGDRDVQHAYGARDAWQVFDRVARELGGAVNAARYRALAEAGGHVLGWLADHADVLGTSGTASGSEPAAADLVDAVEQWLAAAAVSDDAIESHSQPTESPTSSSSPISIPSLAHDLLEAIGLGATSAAAGSLVACFQGARRSGKTLAAHVVAHALGREIVRIDLAALLSKYVGETEKQLAAVIDAAERAGAVLLIDEAGALFGKRSEVDDAHDKYANIDVAYLLQRIECYEGLVIITSNTSDDDEGADKAERPRRRPRRLVSFPRPR